MSALDAGFVGPLEDAVSIVAVDLAADVKVASSQQSRVSRIIQNFGSVSGLIRMGGVAAMVVSMCLYLIDGLDIVNDTQRFMSMLILTGLLSAGGFVLAFLLREQRGARAFFGLALLSVPVNFTVLGALFYSVFQFDNLNKAYPTLAEWHIGSIASLGTTVLIAFAALIPVTVLGVSVMAKAGRGWLGTSLLVSSSMLLLPARDSMWIAPLVALMVVALIMLIKRFGENSIALKTVAGRYVQFLLFLPPVIMLFRSFWLYEIDELTGMMIALTGFVALRYFTQRLVSNSILTALLHWLSAATALIAGLLAVYALPVVSASTIPVWVFCTTFGALMLELESRIEHRELAQIFGIGTAIVLSLSVIYSQLQYSGIIVFLSGLAVLVGVIFIGVVQHSKEKTIIGSFAMLAVTILNASEIVDYFASTGWLGFASLGAAAIVTASLLDRFGPLVSERLRHRFARGAVS